MEEIEFNEGKFRELILYVAAKSASLPKFGKTKLNKILFFCDFLSYGKLGHPVTGATYVRGDFGPIPVQAGKVIKRLQKAREADYQIRGFGPVQEQRLTALREPKLDQFSGPEIAIVDAVLDGLKDFTATEASHLSHLRAKGWQQAANGEPIPYTTVFVSTEQPTADDIKWASDFAAQHGWAT